MTLQPFPDFNLFWERVWAFILLQRLKVIHDVVTNDDVAQALGARSDVEKLGLIAALIGARVIPEAPSIIVH